MLKKLTVVGRGTVGCLSVAHFLRYTNLNIDWIYDPSIPTASVGEGTTVNFPISLNNTFGWNWEDIKSFGATPKLGLYKENWSSQSGSFYHSFNSGTTGIHFNATKFQEKAFNQLKTSNRVNLIECNIKDYENLDSDYVLVCAGSPKNTKEFITHDEIPVNSAYITQCYWDTSRFLETLTIARPYGWVFGIPLQNRCSIGYLYNKNINSIEDIKSDVQEVFKQFNLNPSDNTNNIHFNNYSRKINYTDRIAFNGNSSFFLEPLEATSLVLAETFNRLAFDVWFSGFSVADANFSYSREIKDVKSMINLHYMAGSCFKTSFWNTSKEVSDSYIKSLFDTEDIFTYNLIRALNMQPLDRNEYLNQNADNSVGTWPSFSYKYNSENLGIESVLRDYDKATTRR